MTAIGNVVAQICYRSKEHYSNRFCKSISVREREACEEQKDRCDVERDYDGGWCLDCRYETANSFEHATWAGV